MSYFAGDPAFFVVGRDQWGQVKSLPQFYSTWEQAKKLRNAHFQKPDITHCWVEKRWHGERWNTRRFGHVLKKEKR